MKVSVCSLCGEPLGKRAMEYFILCKSKVWGCLYCGNTVIPLASPQDIDNVLSERARVEAEFGNMITEGK